MSYYDVIIDDTIDISFLLTKTSFNIQMPENIYQIDLTEKMPNINNFELLGSTANAFMIRRVFININLILLK